LLLPNAEPSVELHPTATSAVKKPTAQIISAVRAIFVAEKWKRCIARPPFARIRERDEVPPRRIRKAVAQFFFGTVPILRFVDHPTRTFERRIWNFIGGAQCATNPK
jgi:hypothetical protein